MAVSLVSFSHLEEGSTVIKLNIVLLYTHRKYSLQPVPKTLVFYPKRTFDCKYNWG